MKLAILTATLVPIVLAPCAAWALVPPVGSQATPPDSPRHPDTGTEAEVAVPHYLSAGEGDEALVLVHGWASSTVTWTHQFPALAERARVLAVDLPGHGESEPPAAGYSMNVFADAVAAAMDDAGVKRAVLVGHSNGTPVALNFARMHPERTLGVVAVDGAVKAVFEREQAEAMFAPFRGEGWQATLGAVIDGMAATLPDDDRKLVREMALATPHETVVGGFEAALDPAAWSDGRIETPLMLVLAAQPTWNEAYEAWVRERAPHVDYRVWQGVGHFLHMERPDAFRAALEEFLEANDLL